MSSDFDRELSEARIEQERDAKVIEASKALKRKGTLDCVDCGGEISKPRRIAYPSATRCIDCQTSAEREVSCR